MNRKAFVKKVENYVKRFKDPHHGYFHLDRVRNHALHIAKKEGGDEFTLELACLLHDIAKNRGITKDHSGNGARIAERLLIKMGLDRDNAEKVGEIIYTHSRREGGRKRRPKTLEQKILWDADGLDLAGIIGILRVPFHNDEWGKIVGKIGAKMEEYYFFTKTAKEIVRKRKKFVDGVNKQLIKEIKYSSNGKEIIMDAKRYGEKLNSKYRRKIL